MLYINSSVTCLQFAPKWSFSYFQPILVAIFVTIATVKVELIPDLYTCEEQLLFFDLIGGPKWPLNACTPLNSADDITLDMIKRFSVHPFNDILSEILTHISLVSFLCDIGKQCKTRSDAANRGVSLGSPLFAYRNVF